MSARCVCGERHPSLLVGMYCCKCWELIDTAERDPIATTTGAATVRAAEEGPPISPSSAVYPDDELNRIRALVDKHLNQF